MPSGAIAATADQGGCRINAVISQDITRSFSDANLTDTKAQIEDAAQSFVGSPYPVTLGVTTFGRNAPLPSAPPLLGVDATTQSGVESLKSHVTGYQFDQVMSGYTNWQAGLRDAFEKAKQQGANTVVFVTDGVPNAYVDDRGVEVGVGGWGTFDPKAAAAAAAVAEEIRAAGMNLETVFIRTGRSGFHGLDDPELPTSDAQVEEAMSQLHAGWTIDRVITIAQLADELKARAAAACAPKVSLTKSHGDVEDVNGNGFIDAGDRVVFVFNGRNEGNLPLTGVKVTDDKLTERGVALVGGGLIGDLAIDQPYTTKSEPYTITEQDMLDCGFDNIATTSGTSLKGALSIQDKDTVVVDTRPDVSLTTTVNTVVDANHDTVIGNAGDTVSWTVDVTNTGNVTWKDADVTAELMKRTGLTLAAEQGWNGSLAPGGTISFVSTPYMITAADEAEGVLRATATVTAPSICAKPIAAAAQVSFNTAKTPVVTPTPTPAAAAPHAFTGNPLSVGSDDWVTKLLLGVGGLSAAALLLLLAGRRQKRDVK